MTLCAPPIAARLCISLMALQQSSLASSVAPKKRGNLLRTGSATTPRKAAEEAFLEDTGFFGSRNDAAESTKLSKGSRESKDSSSSSKKTKSKGCAPPLSTPFDPSTTTNPSVCGIPDPPVVMYEDCLDVTECGLGNQTINANNTFIRLQGAFACTLVNNNDFLFFLGIVGDNNTVDCGGYSVSNTGVLANAFNFNGVGNVLQNCPNITGFLNAVRANQGRLFVRNITADGNINGLSLNNAEGYVSDSEFINNSRDGVVASADSFSGGRLVLKGSNVTNNGEDGVNLFRAGEACLEDNVIAQNVATNVNIRQQLALNVTLAENDFCDELDNVDIFDNTGGVTTILDNVQCESVCADFDSNTNSCTDQINAADYGCVSCT